MLDIAHPSHVVTHTRPPRGKPWVNVRHRASGLHSPVQTWLHWAVAGLILLQYMAFDGMGRPFSEGVESGAMPYTVTTITHIALGTLVLVLASWRLVIRLRIGAPPPPEREAEIATVAAKVAHVAPYVLLVTLPITGLAAWFLGAEGLAAVHAYGSTALLWLLVAHVLAVVVHQVRRKTDLLRRMA